MTIGPTTIDLEEWLHRLCAEDEQLTKELEEVRAQIAEIRLALGVHGKWREANPPEGEWIHDHIKPRDISRCQTQRDALEKIAMLSGGIANATEAAKIIVNTKLSKGKQTSVVSDVHGIMTNDESWEWVAPGTFRLRAYASQEQGGELTEVSPMRGMTRTEITFRPTMRCLFPPNRRAKPCPWHLQVTRMMQVRLTFRQMLR